MEFREDEEKQCTVCGEHVGETSQSSAWLCVACADSWERELQTVW